MVTPAGIERFFDGAAELPSDPFVPDAYSAVAHGAWLKVVGPPLAETDSL